MTKRKSGKAALENLYAAALVGLMSLVVFIVQGLSTDRVASLELASILALSGGVPSGKPVKAGDSAFQRVFPIKLKSRTVYGSVLEFKGRFGSSLYAAVFGADGGLEVIAAVGDNTARLPPGREGWFEVFMGSVEAGPLTSSAPRTPDGATVSGASMSFRDASEVLSRASILVRRLSKEGS